MKCRDSLLFFKVEYEITHSFSQINNFSLQKVIKNLQNETIWLKLKYQEGQRLKHPTFNPFTQEDENKIIGIYDDGSSVLWRSEWYSSCSK